MTPLIQKAVTFFPRPEDSMWFDIGNMESTDGQHIPMETMLHLPFKTISVVGRDISSKPFAIRLAQGDDNITVVGCSFPDKVPFSFPMDVNFFEPFSYVLDPKDGRLTFYRKKTQGKWYEDTWSLGDKIHRVGPEEVAPLMKFVASALVRLSSPSTGYRATPKRTFINQKRAAKGKPALSFDWHTVEIVPPAKKNDPQGGTHASPRLHDRRGHWRTCKSGLRVWIRDCKVGDASKGVIFKDYKVPA
jgi:hypothetical protein